MSSDLDTLRARAAASPDDADPRLMLAMTLIKAQCYDEATQELVRLWDHEPTLTGPLRGMMLQQLTELIELHPPARAVFAELRASVEPPRGSAPETQAFLDWVALNSALGEQHHTLAWFDTTYPVLPANAALAELVDRTLVRPLMEHGRWADAGRVIRDPVVRISQIIPPPSPPDPRLEGLVPPEQLERIRDLGRQGRCTFASMFVHAMIAAGRHDDARAVAEYCRSVDDSPEMNATLTAAGTPSPS